MCARYFFYASEPLPFSFLTNISRRFFPISLFISCHEIVEWNPFFFSLSLPPFYLRCKLCISEMRNIENDITFQKLFVWRREEMHSPLFGFNVKPYFCTQIFHFIFINVVSERRTCVMLVWIFNYSYFHIF